MKRPEMVVVGTVFKGGRLCPRYGSDRNDVEITEVPTQRAGRHDDDTLPRPTTQLTQRRSLRAVGHLSLLTQLVETQLY